MERLSDIERKILRIIINMIRVKGRPPTVSELMAWTGRNRGGVYTVLDSLDQKGYIEWSAEHADDIKLIKR